MADAMVTLDVFECNDSCSLRLISLIYDNIKRQGHIYGDINGATNCVMKWNLFWYNSLKHPSSLASINCTHTLTRRVKK